MSISKSISAHRERSTPETEPRGLRYYNIKSQAAVKSKPHDSLALDDRALDDSFVESKPDVDVRSSATSVGTSVGAAVGATVGKPVGRLVGANVGDTVGGRWALVQPVV